VLATGWLADGDAVPWLRADAAVALLSVLRGDGDAFARAPDEALKHILAACARLDLFVDLAQTEVVARMRPFASRPYTALSRFG